GRFDAFFRWLHHKRRCVFCGPTAEPLTREHLWPQWISTELEKRYGRSQYKASLYHVHSDPEPHHESPTRRWSPRRLDRTLAAVCRRCNNEWLSDFENNHAKRVVLPLILGGESRKLGVDEQVVLAAWTYKLSVLLDCAVGHGYDIITARNRRVFRDTLEPQGNTSIWLAHYRGASIARTMERYLQTDTLVGTRSRVRHFCATGLVGRLAFQVFITRLRLRPFISTRWNDATVRIWPGNAQELRWPPILQLDDDGIEEFADRWEWDQMRRKQQQ